MVHIDGGPFLDLYPNISHYSSLGDVILLGDFNARTGCHQVSIHDIIEDELRFHELDIEELGVNWHLADITGPITTYGRHLLVMGESNGLVILNGIPCFLGSNKYTCFPHKGGVIVVNYILAEMSLIQHIHSFHVFDQLPLADHAYLDYMISCPHSTPSLPSWNLDSPSHISIEFDCSFSQACTTRLYHLLVEFYSH